MVVYLLARKGLQCPLQPLLSICTIASSSKKLALHAPTYREVSRRLFDDGLDTSLIIQHFVFVSRCEQVMREDRSLVVKQRYRIEGAASGKLAMEP